MRAGICRICGNVARQLTTCQTCGAEVCNNCMLEGICERCRRGKQVEGQIRK